MESPNYFEIFQKNIALFTDDERAANAYYDWNMYKTVATKYRHTKKAAFVRSHCDKLIDYTITL